MKKLGILLILLFFMPGAIGRGEHRHANPVLTLQNQILARFQTFEQMRTFPKNETMVMLNGKMYVIPSKPRECIRCVAGNFMRHKKLLTEPQRFELITWRDEWLNLDCLKEQFFQKVCAGQCVTVIVEEPRDNGFQAKSILKDCADDLFRWKLGLPIFGNYSYDKNDTFHVEMHGHRIKYDFTWHGSNDTVLAHQQAKKVLHRHFYERMNPETFIIYIVAGAFSLSLVCCFICCFVVTCCKERCNRRRIKRQSLKSYVSTTPISIPLATPSLKESSPVIDNEVEVDEVTVEEGIPLSHTVIEKYIDESASASKEDAVLEENLDWTKKKETDNVEIPEDKA